MNENIQSKYCNNCGTELIGNFCHNCGQKKYDMHHFTMKHYINHFFDTVFNWDSKFLRTMKAILFKPGLLTNEYISGRFEPYVMPLKLYLFVALVVFFISSRFETDGLLAQNLEDNDIWAGVIKLIMDFKGVTYEVIRDKVNEDIYDYFSFYLITTIFVFSLPLKLIYISSKRFYVEHLVFSTHFFTFFLINFEVFSHTPENWEAWAGYIPWIIQFIYLFAAMKKVYNEKTMISLVSILMFIIFFICIFFLFFASITLTALLV